MNDIFYPSINGIYFKNFDMVEDSDGMKHIRGDLYQMISDAEDKCVGHYNPVYQTENNKETQFFLRIEDDFKFLYDTEEKYESLFNKVHVPLTEYVCPVGLSELIADLEIITYLYEFMKHIKPDCAFESLGLVGIINGANEQCLMRVVQIKDKDICSQKQIIEFIDEKIPSITLDKTYPVKLFRHQEDFNIRYVDGKILNIVQESE